MKLIELLFRFLYFFKFFVKNGLAIAQVVPNNFPQRLLSMVHSIRKVSKETQNQNNFVPKELRKKKKPLSTPTTLSLPTLAKLQKIDRFGRPLSSKTESEFQKVSETHLWSTN